MIQGLAITILLAHKNSRFAPTEFKMEMQYGADFLTKRISTARVDVLVARYFYDAILSLVFSAFVQEMPRFVVC